MQTRSGCAQVEFDTAIAQQLNGSQGVVDVSLGAMQQALESVVADLEADTGASLLQVCTTTSHMDCGPSCDTPICRLHCVVGVAELGGRRISVREPCLRGW